MKKEYDKAVVGAIKEALDPPLKERPGHFALYTQGGGIFNNEIQREELRLIMESVVIIQATHIVSLDQIAYLALCEQFAPVKDDGSIIPSYVPMFKVDENGKKTEVIWEVQQNYAKLN